MWVGSASAADHLRRDGDGVGGGVAGPGVAARPGTVPALADATTSLVAPTGSRWRWRWRAAPGGVTWSRRSRRPASRRTWPSRPTRRRRGAASGTPRPIVPTPGCCASCCSRGDLPESWIPPTVVLEWRERVRLYKSLVDQRRVWIQRIHAELFQHGVAVPEAAIRSASTRARLISDEVTLTPAGRQRVRVGYTMLEATDVEAQPLKAGAATLRSCASRRVGRWSTANYGIGGLIAVAVWSELGDCRRFSRSEQVVRHTGLDVTVDASDRHRAHGYLSRQGPPTLRWALFEAARTRPAPRSPDHAYYTHGEGPSRRQAGRDLGRPPVRPPLLPHPAQPRSRRRLRRCRPDLRRLRRPGSPTPTSRVSTAVSSCHRRARQPSGWTAFITLTRPRSQPTGDTQSRLLSPTTRRSSSTQETQGAPTPPSTGPYRVCTGPRVGQGRTSSLRCGRSTLTNACGPEHCAPRGP